MEEKDKENSGNDAEAAAEKEDEAAGKAKEDGCSEIRDRLLRLAAEFDNYKKRVAKEMDGAKDVGKADAISRLLPTLDEFELALGSFGKQDEHMKGMELIFSNFISALKGLGLKEIDVGGRFDPYKHEIVLNRESSMPDGEILEVVRKGYVLNNIMLRPASVIISKYGAGADAQKEEKGGP